MNIDEIADLYCENYGYIRWEYRYDRYPYVFLRFDYWGDEVCVRLADFELIDWYEKYIEPENERIRKRNEKFRNKRREKYLKQLKDSNKKNSTKKLCPKCNNLIEENATKCIYCKYDLEEGGEIQGYKNTYHNQLIKKFR